MYLSGLWKNNADNFELAGEEGEILLIFKAKNANIVAGSDNSGEIFVYLNNAPLDKDARGQDVKLTGNNSIADIREFKLYNLVSAKDYDLYALDLVVEGKCFKIYTFTFG